MTEAPSHTGLYKMMTTANKVAHFFGNSPKRQLELEKWIEMKQLKTICRTRWINCHEAFQILFLAIVSYIEAIANSSPA